MFSNPTLNIIIKSETYDNKIYYSANSKHPFTRPLTEIFSKKVSSSRGQEAKVSTWEDYTRPVKHYLKGLVVTNRLPGQDGIDLLIIGNDKTKKLTRWAEVVEKKLGKPINYVIMPTDDFVYRRNVKDRFITEILEMEILEIIDPENIIKD